jgi:hypothetical protein
MRGNASLNAVGNRVAFTARQCGGEVLHNDRVSIDAREGFAILR